MPYAKFVCFVTYFCLSLTHTCTIFWATIFFFHGRVLTLFFLLQYFCTVFRRLHQLSLLDREGICSCKPWDMAPSSREMPASHMEPCGFRWESSHEQMNFRGELLLCRCTSGSWCLYVWELNYRNSVSWLKIHHKELYNTLGNKNW